MRRSRVADSDITICRLPAAKDVGEVVAQVDGIFFEASSLPASASPAARAAFRERWLGRYLADFPDEAFLACRADGRVIGYLVGCLEDPAQGRRFEDLSYFSDFAELTQRFPAHLHVNLKAAFRGRGVGANLVEAFASHATAARVPGMHVVTGEDARNATFYRRCGFEPLASAEWNGRRLVFFGRSLA